jgi:hypothetical protein
MVGLVARIGAAYGKIDWSSAAVADDTLTVALEGRTTRAWRARLAGLVAGFEAEDRGWASVRVTRTHVRVDAIRPGAATALHALLESLVRETNADFAPPLPRPAPAPVDHRSRGAIAGSLALMVLAAGAVALQWASWEAPVRAVVVVTFVVIGPGWAVLRLWGLDRGWEGIGLVLAVSLALAMVVAGGAVYAGWWSPLRILEVLAGVTVLASLASLARALDPARHRRAGWPVIEQPRG